VNMLHPMKEAQDRYEAVLAGSRLQLFRLRRVIDFSGVQIASSLSLIHESEQLLARMPANDESARSPN
jgi:hypothetical protein